MFFRGNPLHNNEIWDHFPKHSNQNTKRNIGCQDTVCIITNTIRKFSKANSLQVFLQLTHREANRLHRCRDIPLTYLNELLLLYTNATTIITHVITSLPTTRTEFSMAWKKNTIFFSLTYNKLNNYKYHGQVVTTRQCHGAYTLTLGPRHLEWCIPQRGTWKCVIPVVCVCVCVCVCVKTGKCI